MNLRGAKKFNDGPTCKNIELRLFRALLLVMGDGHHSEHQLLFGEPSPVSM